MVSTLLLTGEPGVGKTTALKNAVRAVGTDHCGGFYTEEVVEEGVRVGFTIATLSGASELFAHKVLGNLSSQVRVGHYHISIDALETMGVGAVKEAMELRKLLVIDEIGPMQLESQVFRQLLQTILTEKYKLIGTIVLRPHPIADTVKNQAGVKLLHVTKENRELVAQQLLADLQLYQMM